MRRLILYMAVTLAVFSCTDGSSNSGEKSDTPASVSPPPAGMEGDLDTGTGQRTDTGTGRLNGTGGATGD